MSHAPLSTAGLAPVDLAQQVAPARPFADQLAYVIGAEVLWVKAG